MKLDTQQNVLKTCASSFRVVHREISSPRGSDKALLLDRQFPPYMSVS